MPLTNFVPIEARYYMSTPMSAFTALTILNFDSKDVDTHNAVTVGASWRFTAPVAGRYEVKWFATSGNVAWTVGLIFYGFLYKNGLQPAGVPQCTAVAQAAGTYRMEYSGADWVDLAAGEYVDFRAQSDVSQIPLSSGCWITVKKIG